MVVYARLLSYKHVRGPCTYSEQPKSAMMTAANVFEIYLERKVHERIIRGRGYAAHRQMGGDTDVILGTRPQVETCLQYRVRAKDI